MPYSQAVSGQVTATITTTARMSNQAEIDRKRVTVGSARCRRLLRHITVPSFTTARWHSDMTVPKLGPSPIIPGQLGHRASELLTGASFASLAVRLLVELHDHHQQVAALGFVDANGVVAAFVDGVAAPVQYRQPPLHHRAAARMDSASATTSVFDNVTPGAPRP